MKRLAATALMCLGCASTPRGEAFFAGPSAAHDIELAAQVIDYWDTAVGWRKPFSLHVDPYTELTQINGKLKKVRGLAHCSFDPTDITIFTRNFSTLNYDQEFQQMLLHELGHVHLSCTNEKDHSDDPNSTMHHAPTRTDPGLDCETLTKLGAKCH